MKKTLLLKRFCAYLISIILFTQVISGQSLFVENFDYSVGDLPLTPASVWTSVNTGTAIQVKAGSLTYSGYLPGVGNSITSITGLDYKSPFTPITSGAVYAAFLVNVTSSTTTGDYFFHFMETTASTYYKGRIWLKQGSTTAKFLVGVAKSGTTPAVAYSVAEYDCGTTYLLVLKYQINSGSSTDDVVTLYVNPDLSGAEPASPTVTASDNTTTDGVSIALLALRQGSASAAPNVNIDGIRVATSWSNAITDNNAPVPTFNPLNGAIDIPISSVPTITFDEKIIKTDGTPVTNSDLTSLISFKKTNESGADVPFTAGIDAVKKIITITPSSPLSNSQLYYLAVGPVKDEYGNLTTIKSSTFTTIAASSPSITLTYPFGGEKMYAGQAATITWNSTNITNALIEVWVLDGSSRVWTWTPFVPTTPAAPGKLDITVPSDALYGTEYKVRISDLSNPAVSSTGGTFTIIAVATSITDLRQKCIPNDIVKLSSEATVTFLRTLNRNQKYIQDAGAGLLIDDATAVLTTPVAQGDNIKNLEGKLGLYGGALQIVPTMPSVVVVSSGNTVTIPEMTLAQYMANYLQYESELIKISSVKFTDGNGTATFAASSNYNITDGTNTIVFRSFLAGEGNIVGSVIPQLNIGAVFIGGFYNTTIQVYGRNTSDFSVITGIEKGNDRSLVIYPVPAASVLNVKNINSISAIEILDVTGKVVIRMDNVNQNEVKIPVSNLRKGMYFIKLITPEGQLIKRFIKS